MMIRQIILICMCLFAGVSAGAHTHNTLFAASIGDSLQATPIAAVNAPRSKAALDGLKLYFGQNFTLAAPLAEETGIAENEILISYKFPGDPRVDVPFKPVFQGSCIPAYARSVEIDFVHKTASGERKTLLSRAIEVEQIKADILVTPALAVSNKRTKSTKPGDFVLGIRGIKIDAAKPVDCIDGKTIPAMTEDLELLDPEISASTTSLKFYKSDADPDAVPFVLTPKNSRLESYFDKGEFFLTLYVLNIPKSAPKGAKFLRGALGLKFQTKLLNRKAIRSASGSMVVTVNLNVQIL